MTDLPTLPQGDVRLLQTDVAQRLLRTSSPAEVSDESLRESLGRNPFRPGLSGLSILPTGVREGRRGGPERFGAHILRVHGAAWRNAHAR